MGEAITDELEHIEFRLHPNGRGRVCPESNVTDEVFLGPEVSVVRSDLYGETSITGHVYIEDSEISRSKVNAEPSTASTIRNCQFIAGTLCGPIAIKGCFLMLTELDACESDMRIEYFFLNRSYLTGKMSLIGKRELGHSGFDALELQRTQNLPGSSVFAERYPYSYCPKIIRSHLEGEMTECISAV
ncbi:MAG: hypothetical protein F6J97_24520 [Leptolyngbya sp. SIO4C1]|nr:hypothetical protein [Leptolyngbya sp. SIO4C1]